MKYYILLVLSVSPDSSSDQIQIYQRKSVRRIMLLLYKEVGHQSCYCRHPTGNQQVDAIHVTQLERDTVLVCLDRKYHLLQFRCKYLLHPLPDAVFIQSLPPDNLKIVNLQGRLKSNKKLASELSFDFCIESVGESSDGSSTKTFFGSET